MTQLRRNGLLFALIGDPGDSLWIEIRRERDQAVIVSAPFPASPDEFDAAVEEWIDDLVTRTVDEMKFSWCRSCGALRRELDDDCDDSEMPANEAIQRRFELCVACAEHLVRTNPWLGRAYGPRCQ